MFELSEPKKKGRIRTTPSFALAMLIVDVVGVVRGIRGLRRGCLTFFFFFVQYHQEICIQPGVVHPRGTTPAILVETPIWCWAADPDLISNRFDPICFKTGSESDPKRFIIRSGSGLVRKDGCFKLVLDLTGPNVSRLDRKWISGSQSNPKRNLLTWKIAKYWNQW